MGDLIKLKSGADDFEFSAYHAAPTGPRKGGVVVIQEIFGIDEHIRRDVDRWASLGYEAIAPSLYDRREPGFVAGHDQAGMTAGVGHARATDMDVAMADLDACRARLASAGKVFVLGYCYGGSLTWLAAARVEGFSGASSYYGSMVLANTALKPKCPTIVNLGRDDGGIPADEVKAAVEAAHPDVPVYIYEGAGHGFNNESPERYSAEAADLARHRTLELFDKA
jgi:carboxymethylenebutenolidase